MFESRNRAAWQRALVVVGVCAYAGASHASTLSTMGSWNGSDAIQPFGEPNTATYGQTFKVGADTVMNDFTFYLRTESGPDATEFRGYVMEWGGTKATGPVLFESAVNSLANNTPNFTPFTINTGSLQLTTAKTYVAFFNASKQFDGSNGTALMGITYQNSYAEGEYVYYNNGGNFSSLTSNNWDLTGGLGDAAFTMNFSSADAAVAPLPAAAWAGLALLGKLGLTRRRVAV